MSTDHFEAPSLSLANSGVATIYGFLSEEIASELRSTVNDIYNVMNADSDIGKHKLGHSFQQWNGVWLEPLTGYLSTKNPRLAAKLPAMFDEIGRQTRRAFGCKWEFLIERSFFRRHVGVTTHIGWHVDADAASIARLAGESINVWLPLDRVGTNLPSLEVAIGSSQVMHKMKLLTGEDRTRDDDFVANIGVRPFAPILDVGDALIFDQYTLHRTQHIDRADIVRTSCEFRFAQNRTLISKARNFLGRLTA